MARQEDLAIENPVLAARAADRGGPRVESRNAHESPRCPLTTTGEALAASGTRVAFLRDLYHLGRMGNDLRVVVSDHWRRFGHVQLADVPGRHQPCTGELEVSGLVAALAAATGYEDNVGLEHTPDGPSADRFAWLDPPLRSSRRAAQTHETRDDEEGLW